MNRIDAHEILYAAEAGCEVSSIEITEALRATGDVGDGYPMQTYRPAGTWERTADHRVLLRHAEPFDGMVDAL